MQRNLNKMLQRIPTLDTCKTIKDFAIFVADKFLTDKRVWAKADFCRDVGTYTVKFSAGKPRKAWDALERHGILIHPKSPSSGKPLLMSYVLGKPEEEIDRILTTFGDDGMTRQYVERQPVKVTPPTREPVKEPVVEPIVEKPVPVEDTRLSLSLRQLQLMRNDIDHLESQLIILFRKREQ